MPGTDLTFTDLGTPVISDDGAIAFSARFEGTGADASNNLGYFIYQRTDDSDDRIFVVRQGDDAPGIDGGKFYLSAGTGAYASDPIKIW